MGSTTNHCVTPIPFNVLPLALASKSKQAQCVGAFNTQPGMHMQRYLRNFYAHFVPPPPTPTLIACPPFLLKLFPHSHEQSQDRSRYSYLPVLMDPLSPTPPPPFSLPLPSPPHPLISFPSSPVPAAPPRAVPAPHRGLLPALAAGASAADAAAVDGADAGPLCPRSKARDGTPHRVHGVRCAALRAFPPIPSTCSDTAAVGTPRAVHGVQCAALRGFPLI